MACLRSAASLSIGAALLPGLADATAGYAGSGGYCDAEGFEYLEAGTRHWTPNMAFLDSAENCQFSCQANFFCAKWTWMESGVPERLVGKGACYSFSPNATLKKVNATQIPGRVVSGPKRCDTSATPAPDQLPLITVSGASSVLTPNLTALTVTEAPDTATTEPKGTSAPGVSLAAPATAGSVPAQQPAVAKDATAKGATEGGDGSASKFVFWPILIVLAILAVGGLVYFFGGFGGKTEKKSKSDKKKKKSRSIKPEDSPLMAAAEEAPEAAPLAQPQPPAALPAAPPAAAAAAPAPAPQPAPARAAPVMTVAPGVQAAPVMTAAGGGSVQAAAMRQGASVQAMPAAQGASIQLQPQGLQMNRQVSHLSQAAAASPALMVGGRDVRVA